MADLECAERLRLIEKAQGHLERIAELSYSTARALTMDADEVARLDREAEEEVGRKERTLGALRQHRKDHGC